MLFVGCGFGTHNYLCLACTMLARCAGPKTGTYSVTMASWTWMLRCKSCAAWGCPSKLKVSYATMDQCIKVYDAAGWQHKHDGDLLLKRGMPPQLKQALDANYVILILLNLYVMI